MHAVKFEEELLFGLLAPAGSEKDRILLQSSNFEIRIVRF